MEYRYLGRTGLRVSPLCLGTMNFGPFTSEPDSYAIMDKSLELGIQFFDTADVYGRKQGEGVTESIMGRYFAQGGSRREKVVLATKVWAEMSPGQPLDPNLTRGISARKIMMACENSLRRLQTDWIDLYQVHHVDRHCPWEEMWQAFDTLVQQGKVRYVGSSNFAGWHIATANMVAAQRHSLGLVSEQSFYNLNNRTLELEVIPACRHYGLGLIVWSPLDGGLLGGALQKQAAGRRSEPNSAKRIEDKRPQLERYEALCKEIGEHPAAVGLAWLLHNPVVTAPIIGPRTLDQLTSSLRALEIKLSDDTMKKLNEIFPSPGKEAPEAYAW